jgi:hypothetical protein
MALSQFHRLPLTRYIIVVCLNITTGCTAWVRFPVWQYYSSLRSVQAGSGAHPPYPVGTGGSFPEIKGQGREADNSPPSSIEVKDGGGIPPLPLRLHGIVLN